MNIGILGLLPEQVRIVQQEFPQHALRFLSKDRQSETGTFAKGCDKVVLMTNFIGHDMQDHVPMRKRVPVTGGITKLKRVLNTLPTPAKTTVVAKAQKATLPVTRSKRGEAIDTAPLYAATHVGQVIRLERPKTATIDGFSKRLEVLRSYAKTHKGIATTRHKLFDGYAEMTVKALRDSPPVAALATTAPETTPADTPQETHDMQIAIEVQRPVAVAAPILTQARESAFWQSVFVETMKQWPGAPIDTIAARADDALRAYNARVGMTVSAH